MYIGLVLPAVSGIHWESWNVCPMDKGATALGLEPQQIWSGTQLRPPQALARCCGARLGVVGAKPILGFLPKSRRRAGGPLASAQLVSVFQVRIAKVRGLQDMICHSSLGGYLVPAVTAHQHTLRKQSLKCDDLT